MKTILTLAIALVFSGAYSAKASDTNCCLKNKYIQAETASLATYETSVANDMVFEEVLEEEPVFTSIISKVTPDHIVVKVVDTKGNILFEKNESISKVFTSNYAETNLPTGSMFLMYVDNVAYYYTK